MKLFCQCNAMHRRDVVCGGGAAVFSAIVATLVGSSKPQLDNVCFLNRPVGVKRFQISLFRVKQHPKIQIANYVPWNVYAD